MFGYALRVTTLERWPSWSKAHAWKVCNRQKRFMGSNPILSATEKIAERRFFLFRRKPKTCFQVFEEIKKDGHEVAGFFGCRIPQLWIMIENHNPIYFINQKSLLMIL